MKITINNSKLTNDGGVTCDDTHPLFGMQLYYDKPDTNIGSTVWFNDKVSAVKWMSRNAANTRSPERSFKYTYDAVNRYTASNYAERDTTASGSFGNNVGGFDEYGITYDANGNLITLKRNSSSPGATSHHQIDSLGYFYTSTNNNLLHRVTDGTDSLHIDAGFRNTTGSTSGYTYDNNGNLTSDPPKGITQMTYNFLNRIDVLTISTNKYITYAYDASGNLLKKMQYDNVSGVATLITTTYYIDGFVYLTSGSGTPMLSYFPMPEGRVVNNSGTLAQEFIITDQQGNARLSFQKVAGAAKIIQENSYYATGLIMANSPVPTPTTPNKKLYNGGSEWQNDYANGTNLPDYYQTYNRNYDAAIGRFVGVDPKAESAEGMSVYQYAGDNPVMNNDPMGDVRNYMQAGAGYTGFSDPSVSNLNDRLIPMPGFSDSDSEGGDSNSKTIYNADDPSVGMSLSQLENLLNDIANSNGFSINQNGNGMSISIYKNFHSNSGFTASLAWGVPDYEDGKDAKSDPKNFNGNNYKGGSATFLGGYLMDADVTLTQVVTFDQSYKPTGTVWDLNVDLISRQPEGDGTWDIRGNTYLMINGTVVGAEGLKQNQDLYLNEGEYYVGSARYTLYNSDVGNVTLEVRANWALTNWWGTTIPAVSFDRTVQVSNQNGNAGTWK